MTGGPDSERDPDAGPGPHPPDRAAAHASAQGETGVVVDPGAVAGAAAVVAFLMERKQTLAVAESLTGGLLAAAIVAVPEVSPVFRGGLVVYATDLKASLAGVPEPLLAARGPVDPEVAQALAEGARRRCGADWGLATTGVAGPTAQDGVPVGTVHVAVAGPGTAAVRSYSFSGDRGEVREAAVAAALALLPPPAAP